MPKNAMFILAFVLSQLIVVEGTLAGEHPRDTITAEAMLRTFLLPVNLDDPVGDLEIRIEHSDLRFLCMREIALYYPGIDRESLDESLQSHIKNYGCREVDGTGDSLDGRDHARLMILVGEYAATYNEALRTQLLNK